MQTRTITKLLALLALCLVSVSQAADKVVPGPKGGKILNNKPPYAEFFVQTDRSVLISFYDADLKPVAAAEQSAVVFADAKAGREKLAFEKKGESLISKTPLPVGDDYNVMVQLKPTTAAKAENYKFPFHDEKCGECKRAEYACICEGDHKGHDEKKK